MKSYVSASVSKFRKCSHFLFLWIRVRAFELSGFLRFDCEKNGFVCRIMSDIHTDNTFRDWFKHRWCSDCFSLFTFGGKMLKMILFQSFKLFRVGPGFVFNGLSFIHEILWKLRFLQTVQRFLTLCKSREQTFPKRNVFFRCSYSFYQLRRVMHGQKTGSGSVCSVFCLFKVGGQKPVKGFPNMRQTKQKQETKGQRSLDTRYRSLVHTNLAQKQIIPLICRESAFN